jgi:hypothetical protein
MTQGGAMVMYVLGPPCIGLVGLLARLGWQALRDRRRQDTLRAWAAHLPAAGVLELHDVRDDGSRLHLRISTADHTPVRECHE